MTTDDDTTPIYVRAPADVRARLDAQAASEERSVSAVVLRALRLYFDAHPLPKKGRAA